MRQGLSQHNLAGCYCHAGVHACARGCAQDVRSANVKALTDGSLLALHRDDFDALLGSLSHIRHMWRFEALRKVSHWGADPCRPGKTNQEGILQFPLFACLPDFAPAGSA